MASDYTLLYQALEFRRNRSIITIDFFRTLWSVGAYNDKLGYLSHKVNSYRLDDEEFDYQQGQIFFSLPLHQGLTKPSV